MVNKYGEDKTMTPIKSIRKCCLECSGGSAKEVRECKITDCPLYSFRLGKNPNRKGIGKKQGDIQKTGHSTISFLGMH